MNEIALIYASLLLGVSIKILSVGIVYCDNLFSLLIILYVLML